MIDAFVQVIRETDGVYLKWWADELERQRKRDAPKPARRK